MLVTNFLFSISGKAVEKAKDEKLADAKKANVGKDSAAGKQKVKIVEPVSDSGKKEEDDSDEDESMSEDDDDDSDMGEVWRLISMFLFPVDMV